MSKRAKALWFFEVFIASLPLLIRMGVLPSAQHADFGLVFGEVSNSAEATIFAFILVMTTIITIPERYNVRDDDEALIVFLVLFCALIVLLFAIFNNLAFNVPNSSITTTCFLNGLEADCPYVMRTVEALPSFNVGWCTFNIGAGIISVLACTWIRNRLTSTSTGHSEKEK